MEMSTSSNGISKRERKSMEEYLFKHANSLNEDQKKSLFQEVYILAPNSLTESEVAGEKALALDTSYLTNEILAFMVKSIHDVLEV